MAPVTPITGGILSGLLRERLPHGTAPPPPGPPALGPSLLRPSPELMVNPLPVLQTIFGPSVSSTPPATVNNYQGGVPTELCIEAPQSSRPLLDSPRKRRRLDDCDDRFADLTWSTWMAPPSSGPPTLESVLSRPTTPGLVGSLLPVLQDVLNPPIGPTPPATMNDYQRGLSADPTPLRSPPDAPHRRRRLDGCDDRLADHTDDALVSPDSKY